MAHVRAKITVMPSLTITLERNEEYTTYLTHDVFNFGPKSVSISSIILITVSIINLKSKGSEYLL